MVMGFRITYKAEISFLYELQSAYQEGLCSVIQLVSNEIMISPFEDEG
jgi:hypothetical protein